MASFDEPYPGTCLAPSARMAGWSDFQEIAAWQLARSLKVKVDSFLTRAEFKRRFRFSDQLSDAARSGPANIAEGFGRHGNREFARFVRIAKGSEAEVLNHLIDALDQGLLTEDEFRQAEHVARRAMKAAIGLIRHLESSAPSRTKPL